MDRGASSRGPRVATLAALLLAPVVTPLLSETPAVIRDDDRRVVLELFTSQGCSSCPPAEQVLSRIGLQEELRAKVVPLAFHVDYWNEGGWHDPFSDRAWTQRQLAYDRSVGGIGPYTPQLVVDGRTQFNGGDATRARAEIAAALEGPSAASIALTPQPDAARASEISIVVAAAVVASLPARRLDAVVALFESGLATLVARGENGGRTLQNDFVVRRLKTAFTFEAKPGAREERVVSLKLDAAWKADALGVAAFLQDPKSMRIHAATALASVR